MPDLPNVPPSALVAFGGNAIVRPGEKGTLAEQRVRTRETMERLAECVGFAGPRLVITHGNGPQVGDILLRGELARTDMGAVPVDLAVAETQGLLGSIIATELRDALLRRGVNREVAAVVTTVIVDPADPAFAAPTKPVGPFYPSLALARRPGWSLHEFPPRGWRRVVPSPPPLDVLEKRVVRALYDAGVIVIAGGGGGVPVARRGARHEGVEAVVDKDLTSAILASNLGVDVFAIATGAERIVLGWGTAGAREVDRATAAELRAWRDAGEFEPGTMLPKVDAALAFLERGGKRVVVTSDDAIARGIRGEAGTQVLPA